MITIYTDSEDYMEFIDSFYGDLYITRTKEIYHNNRLIAKLKT